MKALSLSLSTFAALIACASADQRPSGGLRKLMFGVSLEVEDTTDTTDTTDDTTGDTTIGAEGGSSDSDGVSGWEQFANVGWCSSDLDQYVCDSTDSSTCSLSHCIDTCTSTYSETVNVEYHCEDDNNCWCYCQSSCECMEDVGSSSTWAPSGTLTIPDACAGEDGDSDYAKWSCDNNQWYFNGFEEEDCSGSASYQNAIEDIGIGDAVDGCVEDNGNSFHFTQGSDGNCYGYMYATTDCTGESMIYALDHCYYTDGPPWLVEA